MTENNFNVEEYKAKKRAELDNAYGMLKEETEAIVFDKAELMKYLDVQARFNMYSVSNALLIAKQDPEAMQLKTFDDWKSRNVMINKGEKGVCIIEPTEFTKADGGQNLHRAPAEAALVFAQRLAGDEGIEMAEMQIAPVAADIVACRVQRILLGVAAENGVIGSADSNGLVGALDAGFGRDFDIHLKFMFLVVLRGDFIADVGDRTGGKRQVVQQNRRGEDQLHGKQIVFKRID